MLAATTEAAAVEVEISQLVAVLCCIFLNRMLSQKKKKISVPFFSNNESRPSYGMLFVGVVLV